MERKKIIISELTKGILVYAEHINKLDYNWLILISHVDNKLNIGLNIYRYISFNYSTQEIFFDYLSHKPASWGYAEDYNFYTPTEAQKKFIIDKLAEMGYKFIPILNKLVKKG